MILMVVAIKTSPVNRFLSWFLVSPLPSSSDDPLVSDEDDDPDPLVLYDDNDPCRLSRHGTCRLWYLIGLLSTQLTMSKALRGL